MSSSYSCKTCISRKNAATSAVRVLQAVAEVHSIDNCDLYVTASIGICLYPDGGSDAETLIKNADTAMYQAKRTGDMTISSTRRIWTSPSKNSNPSSRVSGTPRSQ